MTPDELDAAIRQELQFAVRLAPDPGPVRRRVLLAAEALDPATLPPRGLRAWTMPLLAAAAAVLVALGLSAAGAVLRADPGPTPPAGSVSPVPASPTPTRPSGSPDPSRIAKPSASAAAAASPSGAPRAASRSSVVRPTGQVSAGRPAGGGPAVRAPLDWYRGLDVATLPHAAGLCPGPVGHVDGMGAPTVSVPGEPAPLWLTPVTCGGDGDPRPVEVFRYTPAGPQLVQTLAYDAGTGGDPRSLVVTAISVGYGRVLLSESGYHAGYDAGCCRSLRFTQAFTWDSGHFVAGPQQDAVLACTDDQLTVSGTALPAPDGGGQAGFVLVYANHSPVPCALGGLPRAFVSDADRPTPTEAVQTANGPLGGLPTGAEEPRLVLFDAVVGSVVVEWGTDQQSGTRCWTAASVTSTPPDGLTTSTALGTQPVVCDPQVHPVVYGVSGRQTSG